MTTSFPTQRFSTLSKAAYTIEVPECRETVSEHLDTRTIQACVPRSHRPINPHSQRLLTAEARAASKVPKATAKGKAKAQTKKEEKKHKGGEKTEDTQAKKKKSDRDREKEEASGVSRTAYSQAKKEFMMQEWFLGWPTCS